jgi:hypothetical protein
MKKLIGCSVLTCSILGVLGVLILACMGAVFPVEFVIQLCFGWVPYLGRVMPQLAWSMSGLATAVLCLAMLSAGGHWFLCWYAREVRQRLDPEAPTALVWTVRKTAAILSVFMLMFIAGIAAVGVSHQTAWLLNAPEPLLARGWAATRIESANNLRNIGFALQNYDSADGHLAGAVVDAQGRPLHGWQTLLLENLEQDSIYKEIDLKKPWNDPANVPAFQKHIRAYQQRDLSKQTADGLSLTHYAGNVHVLGGDLPRSVAEYEGRAATTILVGEVADNFKPWGHPMNWRDPRLGVNQSPDGFGHPRRPGAQFLMMDNSVRTLRAGTGEEVLRELSGATK